MSVSRSKWSTWGAAALAIGVVTEARAEPAVLYVPAVDVELSATGRGDCAGMGGQPNSGIGCADVDEPVLVPAYPDAMNLREALRAALFEYDVHVAELRPPPYLPYTMLLPSEEPAPDRRSFTCTHSRISCAARKRNGIVFVTGPTANCAASDVVGASLYAFGRASGLEGVAEPLDAMHYPPEFAGPPGAYLDGCSPIVNQLGFNDEDEPIMLPLECVGRDHQGCPDDEQNAHVDLMAAYGPRTDDDEPPVLSDLAPGDGAVVPPGSDLVLDVDISDADPVVGGRWTVRGAVFEDNGFEDGVSICTNFVCDADWDSTPLKPTDSDWSYSFSGLPEGTYEITFEAADFHGNVTPAVTMVVTIGEVAGTTTGRPSTTSGGETGDATESAPSDPPLDGSGTDATSVGPTPMTGNATGSASSGPEQDDGAPLALECRCRSWGERRGSPLPWLVLLAPLARRRSNPAVRRA